MLVLGVVTKFLLIPDHKTRVAGRPSRPLFFVIPGRPEGPSPESRNKFKSCIRIPGPALRAVPA